MKFSSSSIRVVFVVAFLICAFTSSAAPQQAPNIGVSASATPNSVSRGRSVRGSVVMDIPSGYHVNSSRPLEKFLIPTQLTIEAPEGIRASAVSYPRAVLRKFKFSKNNVSVYEGRATMRFTLTVPANISGGSKEIKLKLRFQSCNDELCFPPQTKQVSVWVNVN